MSDSHAALIAELAAERQQTARLREALKRTTHVLDHWVTEHGCFHPEDASPWNDETHEGIEALIAAKETLAALAGEETPLKLRVTRRTDDWHACIDGEPALWACGSSHTDALGDLLIGHRERFGVAEIIVDDWRNRELKP